MYNYWRVKSEIMLMYFKSKKVKLVVTLKVFQLIKRFNYKPMKKKKKKWFKAYQQQLTRFRHLINILRISLSCFHKCEFWINFQLQTKLTKLMFWKMCPRLLMLCSGQSLLIQELFRNYYLSLANENDKLRKWINQSRFYFN